ncbi:epithelial membrane protein 1 [Xenopus tropicalis]|uniref:Epithelial membrane protein 1 n=1 Tax=Xenopus tropicalis TaxID=8364 RepID=A0A803KGT9_XENTR|nr:epithelial membrane protein 1 [Xenopus tropicalis]AAI68814.1 Unknown (protein for MGC:188998) [Xenopus tropicalis]|eukprot:NP_001135701.1 epithelial membrane protein 1 [Xenopus tropicalis]
MLVLLAGIFVVHIATVIMLFVATISNVWLQALPGGTATSGSLGIWLACSGTCSSIFGSIPEENHPSMRAIEAFMILAIIFSCFALCSFIGQLFMLEKGCRFYITGALMLVCWLCIMIAVSIYTARFANANLSQYYHGYCFILTWICFVFSFIIGILYLVLRKK